METARSGKNIYTECLYGVFVSSFQPESTRNELDFEILVIEIMHGLQLLPLPQYLATSHQSN
jgi:hypothetical protein